MIDVDQGVQQGDVGPGPERRACGWRAGSRAWPRGSMTIELRAPLRGVLDERRGDRVVDRRVGADDDDHVGVRALGERGRHRPRADRLHQGGDRRGVAEPGAVVDVVAAEPGADQLLEQVRLLVRPLRRAEPGQGPAAVARRGSARRPAAATSSASSQVAVAEVGRRVGRVDPVVGVLGHAGLADQGGRQPVRVVDVVEPEPPLDAEPVVVGRAVAAVDVEDAVRLDLEGDLAADPAIGAEAVDLAVGLVGLAPVGRRGPTRASGRRSGRPGRTRRRRRRCSGPSGRRSRRRPWRAWPR